MLVHHTTRELQERLRRVEPATLNQLTHFAASQLLAVREALDQLRELSNQILGLSGSEGLLELTAGAAVSGTMLSVFLNRGNVTMSNDRYEVGQAGAGARDRQRRPIAGAAARPLSGGQGGARRAA